MPQIKTKTSPPTWHSQELAPILEKLQVNPEAGLSANEARTRGQAWGRNTLPRGKKATTLEMFLRQFGSPLVYILLIAAALTWWIKEYADMTVILVVVAVNALIGFFQEYRASKIFEKLKAIVRVEALVIRDGKLKSVDSEDLVPGDIIILKGGNKVPADARLITANNLEANEALLTGESKPVKKFPGRITAGATAPLGDRTNLVFMGTVLEQGDGRAVVVATGARSEIGQISLLAQTTAEDPSPLQERIAKLATFLTEVFVVISAAIFLLGLLEGDPWVEMFKTTIAVAVAAIPEGLPAAISIILAVSSKKILERKGLVMRLVAAETLGSTSVICADKTGTLTYGEMRIEEIITPSFSPLSKGESERGLEETLLALALANEAVIEEREGKPQVKGEATDKAKLEKFLASGKSLEEVLGKIPRLALLPFDSVRKYLASFHESDKGLKIYVSGAPEVVIKNCKLTKTQKDKLKETFENYARRGFRMIALANKTVSFPRELPPHPDRVRPRPLPQGERGSGWGVQEGKGEFLAKQVNNLTYLGLA